MNKKIVLGLVILIAVAIVGACIWQGFQAKNSVNSKAVQTTLQNSKNSAGGGQDNHVRSNFLMTSGKVASVSDKSVTINLENGGSAIVFYSDKTLIMKVVKLVATDFMVGQSVVVSGIKADDGTVTASTVMVREAGSAAEGNMQQGSAPTGQIAGSNSGSNPGGQNAVSANTSDNTRGFVNGDIMAIDGSKITIKLPDGAESTIVLANDTKITKSETASIKDVVEGIMVSVRGTKGSDGSVVAQAIIIGDTEMMSDKGMMPEGGVPQGGQPMAGQSGQDPAQLLPVQ